MAFRRYEGFNNRYESQLGLRGSGISGILRAGQQAAISQILRGEVHYGEAVHEPTPDLPPYSKRRRKIKN